MLYFICATYRKTSWAICVRINILQTKINKKVWEAYHSWLDTQKVAGECPECGISVKKVSGKTEGGSIQQHKIEECPAYLYGNKKKLKQTKKKK